MFEDRVESVVVQMSMFLTPMMVEVDKVFNVVMRTYVLDVLLDITHTHSTLNTGYFVSKQVSKT